MSDIATSLTRQHTFSGALTESFAAILSIVENGAKDGVRSFSLAVPSPYWRKRLIVALIHGLRRKCIVFTPHQEAQQSWTDSSSAHHEDLMETGAAVWSDQSAHVISTLPYSCAPILVLTDHDVAARNPSRSSEEETDRFVRHLVKHGYGLAILDHTCCTTPERSALLSQLGMRSDLIVIRLATVENDDPRAHAAHCPVHPQIRCRMDEAPFVREGYLFPYRHLLCCNAPPRAQRAWLSALQDQYDALLSLLWTESESARAFGPWALDLLREGVESGRETPAFVDWASRPPLLQAAMRFCMFYDLLPSEHAVFYPSAEARPRTDDIALLLKEYRRRILTTPHAPERSRRSTAIEDFLHRLESQAADPPTEPETESDTGKLDSVIAILAAEFTSLEEHLRALVIVDMPGDGMHHPDRLDGPVILGGLAGHPVADSVHPVYLTGMSVVCNDDLVIPILSEAQKIINMHGWDLQLTHRSHGDFSEVIAEDGRNDPALYVRIVTELCQRGITHCLIAPHDLIASGWDALALNAVIDCTGSATAWFPVPQYPPQKIPSDFPWRTVNCWDIASVDPALLTGYEDWDRVVAKHRRLQGPSEGGWIEEGIGHLDGAFVFASGAGWNVPIAEWNSRFLHRASQRMEMVRAWKIGQAFEGRRTCAFDWSVAPDVQVPDCPSSLQRRQLARDLAAYHDSVHAGQVRTTMSSIVGVGVIISIFLMFEPLAAAIGSGIVLAVYLALVIGGSRHTRAMRARAVPFTMQDWIDTIGSIVQSAVRSHPGGFTIDAEAGLERHAASRVRGRLIFSGFDADASIAASAMLAEALARPEAQRYFVQTSRIDLSESRLPALARLSSPESLERPSILIPIPEFFAASTEGVKSFLCAAQELCGTAVLVSRNEVKSLATGPAALPPVAVTVAMTWR